MKKYLCKKWMCRAVVIVINIIFIAFSLFISEASVINKVFAAIAFIALVAVEYYLGKFSCFDDVWTMVGLILLFLFGFVIVSLLSDENLAINVTFVAILNLFWGALEDFLFNNQK